VNVVPAPLTEKQINKLKLEFDRGDINAVTYYRKLKGLSQEQLASVSGVEARTIFKLETRRVKFPKHLAKSIAEVLGVEPHQLFEGARK
jgi:transcriptional regulator with XRE-family HTH domain